MAKKQTDTLIKPDMKAVLERTHISFDLHGFLLPILEAISNAMHGIEARFGAEAEEKGKVQISIANLNQPEKLLIGVTDNGIGLNAENYQSFRTPFSGLKLKQKGRGFGRFIAFKVHSRILYSSRFEEDGDEQTRTFRFDINQKDELIYHDGEPDFKGAGLRVEYDSPHETWKELISELNKDYVSDAIGSHFLPYFLSTWLPAIFAQPSRGTITIRHADEVA